MAAIVYEYKKVLVFRRSVAVLPPSIHREFAGKMSGGATNINLLHLDIAGAGMQVQQHSAITDLTLNMVVGNGALCGEGMAHFQRSGRSPGVKIERSLGRNFQGNVAGARAQPPVTGGFTFSMNVAASRGSAQTALDAVQLDIARAGFGFHASAGALAYINVAAAGVGKHVAGNVIGVYVAAACLSVQNTLDRFDFKIARA